MQTKKQQKWWKRSLNTFLATVLIASSISFVGVPQEAKAAINDTPISSPAGVDGAALWLRPDKGISTESGELVSEWKDQSSLANDATQSTATFQPTYRNDAQYNVNFNPTLEFNNKYLNLDVAKLPTGKEPRTIVAVAATNTPTGNHYIISWGNPASGQMMGMLQYSTAMGALSGYGTQFATGANFWQPKVPNELFGTFDGINGALYSKMQLIGQGTRPWNTANTQARVGSIVYGSSSPSEPWTGMIADIIVFDRVLDNTERQQLSSYLSIKYGYTLTNVSYLNSSAGTLWDATTNATYHHSVAGIARDDNGGLLQKQSNSTNSGHQVIIGLSEISEKNSSNTAQFSTDMQYLMWGDNNQPFTYTQPLGDRAHTERIWKVQNVGDVGQVEFAIPKDALPEKGALLVGNEDFSSAKEYSLTLRTINGKEYYTTKLTFTDGQYFTLVTTKPELETATLTQTVTDNNEVTLVFDQSVTLTDLSGFTITKDGIEIPIGNVSYKIDGNTIVLTLPTNENVTDESIIKVKYEKDTGNLIGNTNNLPVGDFDIKAVNSFAASLTIDTPTSTIVETPQPEIKGMVEVGSDVEVVIKDKQGNVITNAGGTASVDGSGNWTFIPSVNLAPGNYTIEVKATKDRKTSTKTKPLTIVDKTALQAEVAKADALKATDYTAETWSVYEAALASAQAVLGNDNATQEQVEEARAVLAAARAALQEKPGVVNKVSLEKEVAKADALKATDYTADTWAAYQKELAKAQAVLGNDNATQAEVDAAEAALAAAREALQEKPGVVNKAALQAEVEKAAGLNESDYIADTWAAYQKELAKAQAVLGNDNATQAEVDAA
ncbi:Ig-like domain-containing protein, partial [Lysinibacillus sp. NPDC058154]